MSLRTKLVVGYLIFVAALGGWSAWWLLAMGDVSRQIISNNSDSVIAARDMKENLERQDSAALFALLGSRERTATQLARTTPPVEHSSGVYRLRRMRY